MSVATAGWPRTVRQWAVRRPLGSGANANVSPAHVPQVRACGDLIHVLKNLNEFGMIPKQLAACGQALSRN